MILVPYLLKEDAPDASPKNAVFERALALRRRSAPFLGKRPL